MRTHANAASDPRIAMVAALLGAPAGSSAPPAESASSVIVQADDAASARRLVDSVGGTVTHDLGITRAVGARLEAAQRDRLAGLQGVLRLPAVQRVDRRDQPLSRPGVMRGDAR